MLITADDYGISPAVSEAIRELAAEGRVGAISCMTTEENSLEDLRLLSQLESPARLGLHLTLTGPKQFSFWRLYFLCALHIADRRKIRAEIVRQLARFRGATGRWPDFIDGHQHVQQLPVVREALLTIYAELGLSCAVRSFYFPFAAVKKGLKLYRRSGLSIAECLRTLCENILLALQGRRFRRLLRTKMIPTNQLSLGHYNYLGRTRFNDVYDFYAGLSADENDLLYCHPGRVDQALRERDPVLESREQCFEFLRGHSQQQERDATLR